MTSMYSKNEAFAGIEYYALCTICYLLVEPRTYRTNCSLPHNSVLELNPPASGPKTVFFGHLRFLGLTRENDLFFEPFVGCARKTWQDAGGALSRPTRLHEIDLVASRR